MQFNICGWADHCPNKGGTAGVAVFVADEVQRLGADIVTLNEVCLNQIRFIQSELRAADLFYSYAHLNTIDVGSGSTFCEFGNGILWRGSRGGYTWPEALPSPVGGEPRGILCLDTRYPLETTAVCVTHLTPGSEHNETRRLQVNRIVEILDTHIVTGFQPFLGGDMNMIPWDLNLNPLYLPAYGWFATGKMHEAAGPNCNRGGVCEIPTKDGRQIDYIFSSAGVPSNARSDHHQGWSDHRSITGTFTTS